MPSPPRTLTHDDASPPTSSVGSRLHGIKLKIPAQLQPERSNLESLQQALANSPFSLAAEQNVKWLHLL